MQASVKVFAKKCYKLFKTAVVNYRSITKLCIDLAMRNFGGLFSSKRTTVL